MRGRALAFCLQRPVRRPVSLQKSWGCRSTAALSVATSQDLGVTCPTAGCLLDQELARRCWEMIRAHGGAKRSLRGNVLSRE